MGLDIYVGSLTRYTSGDWLTIIQQYGLASGAEVQVLRPNQPDVITDPVVIREAVEQWRSGLGKSLGVACDWSEDADLPYWTDKPDWDGYGAVLLMAAYDERPDLRHRKAGVLRRGPASHAPARFRDAPAFKAASAKPVRYPSLLSGTEWWLPVDSPAGPWKAPRLTGQRTVMDTTERLLAELRTLEERTGLLNGATADAVRRAGPASRDAMAEEAAPFGLAVLSELAALAVQNRQPLLLDY